MAQANDLLVAIGAVSLVILTILGVTILTYIVIPLLIGIGSVYGIYLVLRAKRGKSS